MASKKVKLLNGLGSYVTIFQPRLPKNAKPGDKPKYSISLIWKKKDAEKALAGLRETIALVATEKFGPKAVELLAKGKLDSPIHDGDVKQEDDPVYADSVYVNAKSDRAPGIIDAKGQPIFEEGEAYSGCFFHATVAVYAYDSNGHKGVALGLNNLMVVKKGERIDGRRNAADDFAEEAAGGGQGGGDVDLSDVE